MPDDLGGGDAGPFAVAAPRCDRPETLEEEFERASSTPDFVAEVDYMDIARDTALGTVSVRPRIPAGLPVRQVRLSPSRLEYFTVRE